MGEMGPGLGASAPPRAVLRGLCGHNPTSCLRGSGSETHVDSDSRAGKPPSPPGPNGPLPPVSPLHPIPSTTSSLAPKQASRAQCGCPPCKPPRLPTVDVNHMGSTEQRGDTKNGCLGITPSSFNLSHHSASAPGLLSAPSPQPEGTAWQPGQGGMAPSA